jgi:hypothetical protein
MFDPAAPNSPLLLVRYNRVRSSSRHLRFALGTVNLHLEGNVAEWNDSAPFLHD